MTDDRPREGREQSRGELPADEEYAEAFAQGYGEGLREALRDLLQHASRGHTAQELRLLIESRLARLSEEVELKRKSLLAPPRRPAWGSLLRTTPPRAWSSAPAGATPPLVARGSSFLIREERPAKAIELTTDASRLFTRVVLVSIHPPELAGIPPEKISILSVTPSAAPGDPAGEDSSPGALGGRLREPTEAPGGALVYLDSFEYLVGEYGIDTAFRFANWLIGQIRATGSALIVSLDPGALELKDFSRLQRAFNRVI